MPPKSKVSADSRPASASPMKPASFKSAAAKLVSARAAAVKMAAADSTPGKPKTGPRFVGTHGAGQTLPTTGFVSGEGAEAKANSGVSRAEPASVAAAPRRATASTIIEPAKGGVEVADKRAKSTTGDTQATAASEPGAAPVIETPVRATASAQEAEAPRAGLAQASSTPARTAVKAPVPAKGQAFKTHEFIVYPAHGVGQIVAVEEQVVAGYKLELFVISFSKDKMILKVPLPKVSSVGMRKLAEPPVVKRALDTLTGRARVKRTMWSRRAQEYEAKINSGDLVAIAEVVRDLYRSDAQPEQSYSERQLYEAALDRIARELAVVEKLTDSEALKLIDGQLQKGPRRGKPDEADSICDELDERDEQGIGEAA